MLVHYYPMPEKKNQSIFGVTPGFVFTKDGNCTVGTYLRIGSVTSNLSGMPIFGRNFIQAYKVSVQSAPTTQCVFRLALRIGQSTWNPITNFSIILPAGQYTASQDTFYVLPQNCELGVFLQSGVTLNNVVLNLFLLPYYD